MLSSQALNIQGRLKFLHGQSRQQCDSEGSAPPQLALFAIATPLQPPAILEIRTRNMIFRTKHKLDFTPMACDAKYMLIKSCLCIYLSLCMVMFVILVTWLTFRGKIVLGYTEAELRVRGSGYQFIHAADMLYCAENHVRSKSQLLAVCMVCWAMQLSFDCFHGAFQRPKRVCWGFPHWK